MALVHNYQESL